MDERSPYESPSSAPSLGDALSERRRRDVVVLRILIVLKVGLLIVGISMGMQDSTDEPSDPQPLLLGALGFLALASFVSWYALAMLKSWGAWLYTTSYLGLMLVGFIFFEPRPEPSAFVTAIDWLTVGCSFSIMVMAHFSCALLRSADPR